ncbi:VWA domain-containing protein [soil metagenome]
MKGLRFSKFTPPEEGSDFDKLLKVFTELLQYTAGDANEAISWLTELDRQYGFTNPQYGMGDFVDDLKKQGFIKENEDQNYQITPKTEQTIRTQSLEEIFGKLKKAGRGTHKTTKTGSGDETSSDLRPWQFGDTSDMVNLTNSLRNAQINHGIEDFSMTEEDFEVQEREHKSINATVLMIDISHSMILYGEDRITPAKKTAMALAELIRTKYPKDLLDIVVFGDDAWPIAIKDLPYLQVGPYHTNTSAGLQLAMDLLRRRKTPNKQIFMITDGKPSCMKVGNRYYKNSFGLDRKIMNDVFNLAGQCRKLNIPITTFMIAQDPYLQQFIRDFTKINNGRAFYSSLNGLGEFMFEDYIKNRKKNVR